MTWVKGQSGNPRGRVPGRKSITDTLIEQLERTPPDKEDLRSFREIVAAKLVQLASEGNMDAIRYLSDRVDGKPTEYRETNNTHLVESLSALLAQHEDDE